MKKIILTLVAVSLTTLLSQAQLKRGSTFPNPSSYGVTGKVPGTKSKVVLYDFWASWCGPCRQAFPAYDKLYQKYRSKGLVVIGVGIDKSAADSSRFLKSAKHSFPVIFDHQQQLVAKVSPPTMPTAYLVGKNGKVLHIHRGFHKNTVKELEAQILAALR